MEEVLDLYAQPPDPRAPLVCLDEAGKELRADIRPPLPPRPGTVTREDHEYRRGGSASFFLVVAPHQRWRQVTIAPRRTAHELAHVLRDLVDVHFPHAERVVLVTDNLNIHTPAALYQTFPPAEACRIRRRLEWHYTPKHGSWLNMAELEASVLHRQCLARRLPDHATLEREVAAWVDERNAVGIGITWHFGIDDARHRLAHVYPRLA